MSTLKSDIRIAAVVSVALFAACHALATDPGSIASGAAEAIANAPQSNEPVTVGGVDVIEVLILALAALGLGPVARILGLLKPVLRPVLKVLLGSRADAPSAPQPSPSLPPSPPSGTS